MSTFPPLAGAEPESDPGPRTPVADGFSGLTASNTTKREYALLELLRSERTFASDLVLLRDYQIPLASGASLRLRMAYKVLQLSLLSVYL